MKTGALTRAKMGCRGRVLMRVDAWCSFGTHADSHFGRITSHTSNALPLHEAKQAARPHLLLSRLVAKLGAQRRQLLIERRQLLLGVSQLLAGNTQAALRLGHLCLGGAAEQEA